MQLSPPDPLEPFRDLKGRSARRELYPFAICEGAFLVESALKAAAEGWVRVRSLLVAESSAQAWSGRVPPGAELLTLPEVELGTLVGFDFHRGVLACVEIPPDRPLGELLGCARLLVLPRIDQEENLGLLLRGAAALGMDGVLLGAGATPWTRRTVRTSMGGVFRIPLWRKQDPLPLLEAWAEGGGEIVAAALGPGGIDAAAWAPAPRCALVLGPEDLGLDARWLEMASRRVAIPMARGMDSLNVAMAGAILMERMRRHS